VRFHVHEQLHVIEQALARVGAQRELQLAEPAVERGLRRHALFLSSGRKPRFRCTSSSEIAAGVIPGMRDAWPSVSGGAVELLLRLGRQPRTSR
jgi:hypothetical protein